MTQEESSHPEEASEPTGFAAVKAKWKQGATKFGSPLPPNANTNSASTPQNRSLNNSHHSRTGSHGGTTTAASSATTDDVPHASNATSESGNDDAAAAAAAVSAPDATVRPFGRRASLSSVPTPAPGAASAAAPMAGFHLNRTRVTTTITTTITTGGKSTVQTNSTHTWRTRPRFSGAPAPTNTSMDAASDHSATSTHTKDGATTPTTTVPSILATPKRLVGNRFVDGLRPTTPKEAPTVVATKEAPTVVVPKEAPSTESGTDDKEASSPSKGTRDEPTVSDPQPQLYKVPKTPVRDWRATTATTPKSVPNAGLSLTTPRSSHTPRATSFVSPAPGHALVRNKSADAVTPHTTTETTLQVPNLNKDTEPTATTAASPSSPRKFTKSKSKDNLDSSTTPRKTTKSKSSTTPAVTTDRCKSTTDLPTPTPYVPPGSSAVDASMDIPVATPYRTRASSTDGRVEHVKPSAPRVKPVPLRRSTKKSHAAASRIKQAVIYTAPKVADFPVYEKCDRDAEVVWEALYKNELFSSLRMGQLNQLVSAFEPCSFAAGDIIMNQGDVSNPKEMQYFYIIDRGTVEFTMDDDKHVGTAEDRGSFGEMSLLYAAPRACTVLALEDARLFRCDRFTFCTILSREMQRCVHQKGRIVDGVQFLANASTGSADVRDFMTPRTVRKGEVIVEQGSISERFFVVAEGEIRCRTIMTGADSSLAEMRNSLKPGEYFGERNLVASPLELSQSTYVAATDGLVFSIDRTSFIGLVGRANFETSAMAILNDANIRRLEEVLFLQKLSTTDIVKLATLLKDKPYKYGDSILTEKESTKAALYIVKSGSLSMSSSENFDRKVLKAGSFFGEAHMQRAHSKGKKTIKSLYTVNARVDCVCSVLTMKDYWSVVGAPENAKTSDVPDPVPVPPVAVASTPIAPSQPERPVVVVPEQPKAAIVDAVIKTDDTNVVREVEPKGLRLSEARSLAVQAEIVPLEKPSPKETKIEKPPEPQPSKEPTASAVAVSVEPKAKVESTVKAKVEAKPTDTSGLAETAHSTDTTHRRRTLIRQSSNLQLEPLNIKLEKLRKHCVLGEGTFGVVWLVSDPSKRTDNYYALKKQSKGFLLSENQVEAVIQEKIMLENMKHPFLICLFATFQDEMFVYMLLDFVQGGELFSLMHEQETPVLPEDQAKFYALCLADVLAYLHKSKYVYRDLKPENVMLDGKGYVKLIDFGFCKYLVAEKTYTLVGTPGYLSPETVSVSGHSFSSDNWSLGILIYEMIVGSSPFYYEDIDQMELFESIVNDPVKPPNTISREASDIILKLLTKDPVDRLGSDQLLDIVEHPWFAELDLDAMRHRDVVAPWLPDVQGPTDTSYFDDWSDLEQESDIDDGNQNGDISKKGQVLSKRDQKLFEGAF